MSGSATDSEKPSDASHRWRRARAMASTKVGDGCRTKRPCAGSWGVVFATRGRPGWSRRRVPVGRAWCGRWRDRPLALCLHTQMGSYLVEGDLQLPAQYKPFQDLGRVRRRVGTEQGLSGEGALGVSNQHPANEDGRLAGAVPDRRLGGEFHGAGDAVVPGHLGAGPSYIRLLKENFQRRPPRAPSMAGDHSGPADGVALGAYRAASRRNLAIRVTGSRRDWQQWSKSSTA